MKFLKHLGIVLGSAALGLIIASIVIPGFRLSIKGFLTSLVVFTVAQVVLGGIVASLVRRNALALEGGIAILSTLAALLTANFLPGSVHVSGVVSWILSGFVVWLVSSIATVTMTRPKKVAGASDEHASK